MDDHINKILNVHGVQSSLSPFWLAISFLFSKLSGWFKNKSVGLVAKFCFLVVIKQNTYDVLTD